MLKRTGIVLALVFPLVAIASWIVVTWTPPVHAVHTAGATSVKAYFAAGWVPAEGVTPRPTTSLAQLRCELWRGSPPCPDAAHLAQRMWPNLSQTPKTLYVPMWGGGVPSSNPSGWNVEYDPGGRTLMIHSYESQPLLVLRRADETPGAAMQPFISLLVVATDAMTPGSITVVEDTRSEHLLGDRSTGSYVLGMVTIP
jgi:hypothetical protein